MTRVWLNHSLLARAVIVTLNTQNWKFTLPHLTILIAEDTQVLSVILKIQFITAPFSALISYSKIMINGNRIIYLRCFSDKPQTYIRELCNTYVTEFLHENILYKSKDSIQNRYSND